MTATLSIFIISVVGMGAVVGSHKLYRGEPAYLRRSDAAIRRWAEEAKKYFRFLNKKTISLFLHFVLEKIEELFNKLFAMLKGKVKK